LGHDVAAVIRKHIASSVEQVIAAHDQTNMSPAFGIGQMRLIEAVAFRMVCADCLVLTFANQLASGGWLCKMIAQFTQLIGSGEMAEWLKALVC
jgi:hypothetical protein